MSKEKKVTDSLVTLMSFVKQQANSSLVEQGRRIQITDENLRKLSSVIEASITNAFLKGMDPVIKEANKKFGETSPEANKLIDDALNLGILPAKSGTKFGDYLNNLNIERLNMQE